MIIFLDANIIFTAIFSKSGASNLLFQLAEKYSKKIQLVTSKYAIQEAHKNLLLKCKIPDLELEFAHKVALLNKVFHDNADTIDFDFYSKIIQEKDAPILHAANKLKANFLITLDKKDFFSSKIKKVKFIYKIVTPGEFLKHHLQL